METSGDQMHLDVVTWQHVIQGVEVVVQDLVVLITRFELLAPHQMEAKEEMALYHQLQGRVLSMVQVGAAAEMRLQAARVELLEEGFVVELGQNLEVLAGV